MKRFLIAILGAAVMFATVANAATLVATASPDPVAQGGTVQILLDMGVACAAVFAVSVGTSGWFRGKVPVIGRLLFLSAAGLLFYAAPAADIVGGLALAGLLAWRFLRGAPQPGRAG